MAYVSLQEKHDHLRCLLHLAKADGSFTLAELTYVVWVAKQLELSTTELERLAAENNSAENLPKVFFQTQDEKLNYFHQLLNLLKVDGLADKSELIELEKIGLLMGFSSQGLKQLIAKITLQPEQILTEEELRKVLSL